MLLGSVLEERMAAEAHGCHLLRQLEDGKPSVLEWYERRCSGFIDAVEDVEQAVQKIEADLLGPARTASGHDFNARLADFFVEISAVYELSKQGYSHFVPLVPPEAKKGQTESRPDFMMLGRPQQGVEGDLPQCYLEVKSLRAPVGILATFRQLYSDLVPIHPSLSRCFIRIRHYWDNTLQDGQAQCIAEFFLSLARTPAPLSTTLHISPDIEVGIEVVAVEAGDGGVCMIRGVGGDGPDEPFVDLQALEKKAGDTVRKAVRQLSPYAPAERMLVLNISTPDAMLSTEIIQLLREIVRREGNGEVECFLLHHHHSLFEAVVA